MLILLSTVHRVALATPNIDEINSEQYINFRDNLLSNGASKTIMKYSKQLYELFLANQLPLNYGSYDNMTSILDSSLDKGTVLSSEITSQQKIKIVNALLKTPLTGSYNNKVGSSPYVESSPSLLIFFSSHAESMYKNLKKLKELTKKIANLSNFPSHVLLASTSTHYTREELLQLKLNDSIFFHPDNLLRKQQQITQADLATEMLRYFFDHKPYVTPIPIEATLHFSKELEEALSEPRNFEGYSVIYLATLQPYCEEAQVIIRNKLTHKHIFNHSCLDLYENTSAKYYTMDAIADSLNAFRHWIKTASKYD